MLRSRNVTSLGLATIGRAVFVLIVLLAIGATHARWIFTHFSSDGYLQDSGWIAYLFASGDPLLHNPKGINTLSFYAHHLSPHIFLFGVAPSRLLHLTGIQIFAAHQAVFFGLFFVSLYLLIAGPGMQRRDRLVAIPAVVLLGGLSNALLQAAGYPHYEIAMLSIASLAIAAWFTDTPWLFALCATWLPLIREDGGFYVAVVSLACLALEQQPSEMARARRRSLMLLATAGVVVSALSFLIKGCFFPGFDAFETNISGDRWRHVTAAFVIERVRAMLANMNVLPVLVGCALLAIFDVRYLTGLVLMSPLLLLHLVAVRPEHGHFTLYFALPWLFPCVIWIALFANRSRASATTMKEGVIVLVGALLLSAPLHAAVGAPGQSWYVAVWAFRRPVVNIESMKDFVVWARRTLNDTGIAPVEPTRDCVSQGIGALVPNLIEPDDVLTGNSNLRACRHLFLMRGDLQYSELSRRARAVGFEPVGARYNAEMWQVRNR
jgi:hypothetical protein